MKPGAVMCCTLCQPELLWRYQPLVHESDYVACWKPTVAHTQYLANNVDSGVVFDYGSRAPAAVNSICCWLLSKRVVRIRPLTIANMHRYACTIVQ